MKTAISHVFVTVDDHDKALAFFEGVLGFVKTWDLPMPNGWRWLTVAPGGKGNAEIVINKASNDAERAIIGRQSAGDLTPLLILETDDIAGQYARFENAHKRYPVALHLERKFFRLLLGALIASENRKSHAGAMRAADAVPRLIETHPANRHPVDLRDQVPWKYSLLGGRRIRKRVHDFDVLVFVMLNRDADPLELPFRVLPQTGVDIGRNIRAVLVKRTQHALQGTLDQAHRQFIRDIAEGRGMAEEAVQTVADGRIIMGETALSLGLVDELGNFEDAVIAAAAMGGIVGEPQLVHARKERRSLLDLLMGDDVSEKVASWIMGSEGYLHYELPFEGWPFSAR